MDFSETDDDYFNDDPNHFRDLSESDDLLPDHVSVMGFWDGAKDYNFYQCADYLIEGIDYDGIQHTDYDCIDADVLTQDDAGDNYLLDTVIVDTADKM